ncbi:histidine phosphatase family protein [Lysinibacillus sphaericus]|uniref:Fructose-2,6-bisphosphatase n=3 Tax=Lysinibacillus TaxID=400634 RepID=B1HQK8_LYSSC|nr:MULTISPECIES: histidine phosphatase family protein [Lysinibacillus]MBE5083935.1 histidine phosphatase family protein [Bacillus thuringiensis]ACA40745.1 fructose-2,6-bisphosphatase [Lysinibacillus sphaericus C3-41]AMO33284.1 fructose-2,6-bisphosphatase [Lysinibacillus sphaericus]AMR91613.1 fructose-2,6-bisphosphatase [Lysinibacillus sphaericus]ANA45660.1 fructose-2,6-bisphosphatase [Lysinibacillus sphaericus]
MQQLIYLLRHGETEYNSEGRYQGQLDSPLTELGREQVQQNARMLKAFIGHAHDWKIISSPLGRAVESTEILCETIDYDKNNVEFDQRLTEVAVGQWAGLKMPEIQQTWPNLLLNTDAFNWYFHAPDGESYEQVVNRLSSWLKEIQQHHPKVIVVSHGLTGRILRGIYAGLHKEDALKLEVSQDVFFKLANQEVTRICSNFEDDY